MSRFDGFTLHAVTAPPQESRLPLPDGWIRSRTYTAPELLLVGGYVIEPHPKPDAILDADKAVEFPLLRGIGVTEPNPAGVSREASRR